MSKRRQTPSRPRDLNQLAKRIVDLSTGQVEDDTPAPVNEKAAKRGAARAAKLTPEERREIAKKAAGARWKKPA
jgi:aspartate/methionine/tyrosine aminotransferase